MMNDLETTAHKLCQASRKDYVNPYSDLEWPDTVNIHNWFMSPELISLYGTEHYDRLSEADRKKLSFYEAINFFSLNIHGEKSLIEGLAQRLYRRDVGPISSYLHHFLDEENKHMVYFGGFCARYAGKVYPDRKLSFPREYQSGEEDFLFFARVLVFEEIVDVYNVQMSLDERLVPLARQINLMHHRDEARHLVFGRKIVKELFEHYSPRWPGATLQAIREYLINYIMGAWKEYYNPDVYRDAGLVDPYRVREESFNHPRCRSHRQKITRACLRYLTENGILDKEPAL
ncbi:MAG TPA: diiron oxygenase [Candidatus Obscuribacterales bacterium]